MKKLMTMIAAVATAFGLFADEPTTYNGTSFESAEAGVSELKWTPASGVPAGTWSTNPTIEDALDLGEYDGDEYVYPTAAPRRDDQFKGGIENNNYLKLDTGSATVDRTVADGQLFFDQVIKFTGFEDVQTNFVDGTKIAIWTSAIEDDEDTDGVNEADTNLYVAVGDGLGKTVNVRIAKIGTDDITDEFDRTDWHRVTIKNVGEVAEGRAGFMIWIDGKMASIDTDDLYFKEQVKEFKSYYDKGQLFISMDGDSTTVEKIGFQGVGSLDDVVVSEDGPAFAVLTVDVTFAPITGAEIAEVKDADGVVKPSGDVYSVKPGDITVTLQAAGNFIFKKNPPEYTITASASGQLTVPVAEGDLVEAVAKITDGAEKNVLVAEADLLTAVAQVQNGDTITILKECSVTNGVEETPLYTFTPDTTVAVAAITDGSKWTINVAQWTPEGAEEPEGGELEVNVGVAPEKQITVAFEEGEGKLKFQGTIGGAGRIGSVLDVTNGSFTLSDNITVGEDATLKFAKIAGGKKITLSDGAKVYSKQKLTVADIFTNENVTDPEEPVDGFYVYELAAAPTTFTVTAAEYANTTRKVTVDDVEISPTVGNVFTIDAGKTAIVTYTAAEHYSVTANGTQPFEKEGTAEAPTVVPWLKYEADLYINETLNQLKVGLGDGDHFYAKGVTVPASAKAVLAKGDKPFITDDSVYYVSKLVLKGEPATVWNFTYDGTTFAPAQGNPGGVTLNNGVLSYDVVTGDKADFGEVWLTKYEAQDPWKEAEANVNGITPENKAAVEATLADIQTALGGGATPASVGDWIKLAYGDNGSVPAADLAAAKDVETSVKYNLPIFTTDNVKFEIAADAEVADGFTFTLKDGNKEVILQAAARVEEIVRYTADLTTTFQKNTEKIGVKVEDGVIKATFINKGDQGFMKAIAD